MPTPGANATRFARQYAARAVERLRQAVAKGYKNVAHPNKGTDLDPLRDRDDFEKLPSHFSLLQ